MLSSASTAATINPNATYFVNSGSNSNIVAALNSQSAPATSSSVQGSSYALKDASQTRSPAPAPDSTSSNNIVAARVTGTDLSRTNNATLSSLAAGVPGAQNETATRPESKTRISWMQSLEEAQKLAQAGRRGFVLYFKPGTAASANGATSSFSDDGYAAIAAAGIREFVQIDDDAQILKKYMAAPGTVVFCGPDGSTLRSFSGCECNATLITSYLSKVYAMALDGWLTAHPK
jgi:hypothetical protein